MIIKLSNEVFTDIFCSAVKRPDSCTQTSNICCLLCSDRHFCLERCTSGVTPCKPEHFEDDEKCEFLN